jgi:hypothetical protein
MTSFYSYAVLLLLLGYTASCIVAFPWRRKINDPILMFTIDLAKLLHVLLDYSLSLPLDF